jgi:hypothetical protein
VSPHWEVLSPAQNKALIQLGPPMTAAGFYLAGGTAVALQLGHRRSEDLDWLTDSKLDAPLSLMGSLQDAGITLDEPHVSRGTLHAVFAGVKACFMEYRYPILQPLVCVEPEHVRIAALDDLACMKLLAVTQRAARRDFVDLYALLLRHARLSEMLAWYKRKFEIADARDVLMALSYFDDAEKGPMPRVFWRVSWPAVKAHLRKCVAEFAG